MCIRVCAGTIPLVVCRRRGTTIVLTQTTYPDKTLDASIPLVLTRLECVWNYLRLEIVNAHTLAGRMRLPRAIVPV